jgi:anti-sigma factor RsiW
MHCRDVRELADSFLSEQLLVETNHQLVRHLETCPDCRAEIGERRTLRTTLRAAWTRSDELSPRPEFAAELAATLRPSPGTLSRRSLLQSWWAMAAGVILAAGGSVLVRDARARSALTTLARVAAGDHQNCAVRFNLAERPISLEAAGQRYGPPYGALATFESGIGDGLTLLERHACLYQGRRFGHVVYRDDGALVSLLVTDAAPPAGVQLEPNDGPTQVATLPAGRFLGFVVADLGRERVLQLAQTLSGPLSRHLG